MTSLSMPGFCGVILAAGSSSRMGREKALLPWGQGTILTGDIEVLNATCDMVLVVTGKNTDALRPVIDANGAFLVVNPEPERGQFSSLQTGLRAVLNYGRDAAVITLVDRPPATMSTVTRLRDSYVSRAESGIWAVVPQYGEQHGHPIVVGREMITAFLQAAATATARQIEHDNQQHIAYVPVDDPLTVVNIDTPDDYQRLLASRPR